MKPSLVAILPRAGKFSKKNRDLKDRRVNMSFDLVCLGEILIDMFPSEVGRKIAEVTAFHPNPGGAPANVAVAAARLGKKSAFIGKVGEDAFGYFLKHVLEKENVEVKGLRFDPDARTTMVFIALPDAYHAEFVFYRNPGADLLLQSTELDTELLTTARGFHFGSLSLVADPARSATHTAIDLARNSGALISYDMNYRPSLWKNPDEALQRALETLPKINLLKVNEVEVELLSGETDLQIAGYRLLEMGPELVVITLGARGSYYCSSQASGFVPAFLVDTVDAIGCGDAFIAGLLSQILGYKDWREMLDEAHLARFLRYANAVGALTALKHGAIPALPTATEVASFLELSPALVE